MDFLRQNIGIDVGTSKAVAYLRGKGVVFNEPSMVALDHFSGKILAVGEEAKTMLGRTPGNVSCVKPIQEGVIANFEAAESLLRHVIKRSLGRSFFHPNVILSVPSHVTQVQKRALMQACKNAGAHKVFLIEEVLASAFGIGIDIKDPQGHLILDIGAGSISIGIVASGQVILSEGRPLGGDSFNEAIKRYINRKYGIYIGDETAENIKLQLGTLMVREEPFVMEVAGRSKSLGLPEKIFLNSNEVVEALTPIAKELCYQVKILLSKTPPELAADLFERGAYLTGSSAQIEGMVELLEEFLSIPVTVADMPGTCTVRGTAKAMQWMQQYDPEDKKDFIKRDRQLEKAEILRKR